MRFDYIVVGGGSSGCVTAARLVRDFGARVLLLEAGHPDTNPLIRMPAGFVRLLFRPSPYVVGYESEPQAALGGRTVKVMQANVLGGGSSVNAMTYTRGTRADYDRWQAGVPDGPGWGWNDLLPHFIRQEANQRLGAPLHGTQGALKVSDPHHPPVEISTAFALALQELGLPYRADLNDGDERGVSLVQATTFRGERWSAARAFIEPLLTDSRLTIRYQAPALRLIFEGSRAIGVEFGEGGGITRAYADAEIVLTAGSFISPKLLMLSGVGPADQLRSLAIDVRVDSPGVGVGMQDHNDASLLVETDRNYGYSGEDRGWRMLRNGLHYLLLKAGPVSSTGSEVTAFLDPTDLDAPPTVQFYCLGTLVDPAGKAPTGATLTANLIGPKSRGRMRLRSADPAAPPVIDPNWLSHPDDVRALVAGLKFLRRVVDETAPFRGKVSRIVAPEGTSDTELEAYVRRVTSTNWHPVGSCRMGPDGDPGAVLDPWLRVRGTEGLRVFDASMMPSIISANTNAPVMAIADRGVELMMGTARRPAA